MMGGGHESDEADESDEATKRRSDEGKKPARSSASSLRRYVASSLFPRFHADRAAGGHRDHRALDRDPISRDQKGKEERAGCGYQELHRATRWRHQPVSRRPRRESRTAGGR